MVEMVAVTAELLVRGTSPNAGSAAIATVGKEVGAAEAMAHPVRIQNSINCQV